MAVEEGQGERDEEAEVPSTEAEAELPELLELIDMVESASGDELAEVISKIGRRIRATPGDRDLLSDFEGIAQICQALEACNWRGPAMLAFCRVMPDVCRTSIVNRASLRDAGFLAATMKMLEEALAAKEEMSLMACCTSIAALCTANDATCLIFDFDEPVASSRSLGTCLFCAGERRKQLPTSKRQMRYYPLTLGNLDFRSPPSFFLQEVLFFFFLGGGGGADFDPACLRRPISSWLRSSRMRTPHPREPSFCC